MNVTLTLRNVTFLASLVLCFAGTALTSSAGTPLGAVTPAQRAAAAITLQSLGHDMGEKLTHGRYEEGVYRGRRVAGFDAKEGGITFDRETGIMVDYKDLFHPYTPALETDPPKLTSAEALQNGLNFLSRTGVTLDGVWTLAGNNYHSYGNAFAEYVLSWERMFNGIRLASSVSISIDANDGHVMRYSLIDDPVVIPLQVNVTGERALAILAEKQGWAHPVVQDGDIAVQNIGGYPGPQVLVWCFKIVNYNSAQGTGSIFWAEVNATTGEIIRLDGAAGGFHPLLKGKKLVSVALPKPNVKALRKAKAPPTVFQLAALKKAK